MSSASLHGRKYPSPEQGEQSGSSLKRTSLPSRTTCPQRAHMACRLGGPGISQGESSTRTLSTQKSSSSGMTR